MNGAFGSSRVRLSYHQGASSLEESWDRSFLAEVGALRERHKKGGGGTNNIAREQRSPSFKTADPIS